MQIPQTLIDHGTRAILSGDASFLVIIEHTGGELVEIRLADRAKDVTSTIRNAIERQMRECITARHALERREHRLARAMDYIDVQGPSPGDLGHPSQAGQAVGQPRH